MTVFIEILEELDKAGHDDVWVNTSDEGESYLHAPNFPDTWRHPTIVTRDGRVIAERIARGDTWSLCGDWQNTNVRPGCAEPYGGHSQKKLLNVIREKRVLSTVSGCGGAQLSRNRL